MAQSPPPLEGLRWLILCVNLIGLRDVQIAGKTLFQGVTMGAFPEELGMRSADGEKTTLTSMGGHHPPI